MKTILTPSATRGKANFGWLNANYYFSFSRYYNPARIHFGALRVLNDDTVAAGMGFGTHPHDNMEIVTIPLKGVIAHKDSTGTNGRIEPGEVQIMSAGTGIEHSEFNGSATEELKLFQIWIMPEKMNIAPRYAQKHFDAKERKGKWQTVVAPEEEGNHLWINQQSWFNLTDLTANEEISYILRKPEHGVYIVVIEGEAQIGETTLSTRDAIGIWEAESVNIQAKSDVQLLLIEVPMIALS